MSRQTRSYKRLRLRGEAVAGVLFLLPALALPTPHAVTAKAAKRQHSLTPHVEPPVAPAVFDGDVRNLPPVPSARRVNIELEGSGPNKVPPPANSR